MSGPAAGHQTVFKISTDALDQLKSAELTLNGKTYDVTVASGTSAPPWEQIIPGTKSWKLKISALYDRVSDSLQETLITNFNNGAVNAISLSPDTGTHSFTGNAYLDGIPMKFPVDGAETIEFSMTGTGALSYT